jgi:hypothetical protein
MKIYCEHGAMTEEIRKLGPSGSVEFVHFPYDPDFNIHKIAGIATPSKAQIRDLNLPIKDLPGAVADYSGSVHFDEILSIIGGLNHRRDALHVDSGFKNGCSAFITRDSDILNHKAELKSLLGINFFHPDGWSWRLQSSLIRAWDWASASGRHRRKVKPPQ